MIFPILTIFDLATIRANFVKPIDLTQIKTRTVDFALLVPIFNNVSYLSNIDFLKKYGSHVILCTTSSESAEFKQELEKIAKENGFRINYSEVESKNKNPWSIYTKTLLAHDSVLKNTVTDLSEKYVVFIDGDTFVDGQLDHLCGVMEEKAFDIASVKVLPSRRKTVMEHLQGVEYDIAMQSRLIYPWLTSGAGMVAKREVMDSILRNHSLFFNGGDVEIGKLGQMMGYKVGHIPMIFYTDVPKTFSAWVKQRFSWMCGMFRHSIINIDHNIKFPFHFIYFSFIIYFLLPAKMVEMVIHPEQIPFIIGLYVVITYLANWKVRSRWMLIFPFYALFQVMVVVWFGIYRYIKTLIITKNFGKIKIKHRPNPYNVPKHKLAYNYAVNLSSIIVVCFLVSIITLGGFQKIVFGREYEALELASNALLIINPPVKKIQPKLPPVGEVAGVSIKRSNYSIEVHRGGSLTKVARAAIKLYLEDNKLTLTASELLYAEDTLRYSLEPLEPYHEGYFYQVSIDKIINSIPRG